MGYTTGHKWSKEDELFLKENYLQKTNIELSNTLKVTDSSVEHKLKRMGLARPYLIGRMRCIDASRKSTKKNKIIINCAECGKSLPPFLPCFAKKRRFCSKSCGSIYLHKHPSEGTIKHRREFGKRVANNQTRLEGIRKMSQREEWLIGRTGEKNGRWQGGISFVPYTKDFNPKLKRHIKSLWHSTCFLCKKTDDLVIHHIDYNKKNSSQSNLVVLCRVCNSRVNANRELWKTYIYGICWGSPEDREKALIAAEQLKKMGLLKS